MTTTSDQELCSLCSVPRDAHGGRRHPFTSPGTEPSTSWLGPRKGQVVPNLPGVQVSHAPQAPFDPILRQALIDKGVLTPEDLTAAEKKVYAVSQGLWGGEQSDATRSEEGK